MLFSGSKRTQTAQKAQNSQLCYEFALLARFPFRKGIIIVIPTLNANSAAFKKMTIIPLRKNLAYACFLRTQKSCVRKILAFILFLSSLFKIPNNQKNDRYTLTHVSCVRKILAFLLFPHQRNILAYAIFLRYNLQCAETFFVVRRATTF